MKKSFKLFISSAFIALTFLSPQVIHGMEDLSMPEVKTPGIQLSQGAPFDVTDAQRNEEQIREFQAERAHHGTKQPPTCKDEVMRFARYMCGCIVVMGGTVLCIAGLGRIYSAGSDDDHYGGTNSSEIATNLLVGGAVSLFAGLCCCCGPELWECVKKPTV